MAKGRSLELYFIDGKPDGMLTAEVFNWTGHVLMTPRTRIKDALGRGEAGYTGVYILLGETEDGPQAYIGEAEDLGTRIRGHVTGKDWWEVAVLITSTANNLHKAHVKYLESRLVEMALITKRMPLVNGNAPTRSSLSESATANMEEFLETLMMVLPAIQVDMFVNKAQPVKTNENKNETTASQPEFEINSPRLGVAAVATIVDGEMIVHAGSKGRKEWVGKASWDSGYKSLRDHLIEAGILVQDTNCAIFTENYAFSSPSAAAAVVEGRAANGRIDWKLKGSNTTYAEWEAAQLAETDTPT
ncbi:GIY-YIG nuclease family protein [Profundibacter sp.]